MSLHFSAARADVVRALKRVVGVVERRPTLAVLSHVLIRVDDEGAWITGTDLEMELVVRMPIQVGARIEGAITVPGRKLHDIVKALPENAVVDFTVLADERMQIKSGRSKFTLQTLPAAEFPVTEMGRTEQRLEIDQATLRRLFERTTFASGVSDVRYYLNGVCVEMYRGGLRLLATDGHRLALAEMPGAASSEQLARVIVPRKSAQEICGLLDDGEAPVVVLLTQNHFRLDLGTLIATARIIDGKFPDCEPLLDATGSVEVCVNGGALKGALSRVAILANEKYRGVKVAAKYGALVCTGANPEQEEAIEELDCESKADGVVVGFNVRYLLDALDSLGSEQVRLRLRSGERSLVDVIDDESALHIVMPLKL